MPVQKLKEFLDANHVKYVTISHSTAYTAQEIAASAHIKGKDLAKTVMVKIDGEMAMAVLPASYQMDFNLLREAAGGARVELASEAEFRGRFPGCETGALSSSVSTLTNEAMSSVACPCTLWTTSPRACWWRIPNTASSMPTPRSCG